MIIGIEPQCQNLAVRILYVRIADLAREGYGIPRHHLRFHIRIEFRIQQQTQRNVPSHNQSRLPLPVHIYSHSAASNCLPDVAVDHVETCMSTENVPFVLLPVPRRNELEGMIGSLRIHFCLFVLRRGGNDVSDGLRNGLCCPQQRKGMRRIAFVDFSPGSHLNLLNAVGCSMRFPIASLTCWSAMGISLGFLRAFCICEASLLFGRTIGRFVSLV